MGSRGTAYAFVCASPVLVHVPCAVYFALLTDLPHTVLFYVVGYIVIASANSVETVAGGIILYAMCVL